MFRRAGEGDLRRRTSDWVRVAIALVLLAIAANHAGTVTASERALFDLFNTLPVALTPLFRGLYRIGALWAVGLVAVAALVGRRWRLARDLLLAGLLAWAIARAVDGIVDAHSVISSSVRTAANIGDSPSFPSVRLAIIVAVITAASPYVTRPTRMIGWVFVGASCVAALYLGTSFPVDLFGGLVLGWGVGSAMHLIFGSPGMRPTIPQVIAALDVLGIEARTARLAREQPGRSTVVLAEDDQGPLRVKVIGRDEAQARLLSKVWVTTFYKDPGPRLALTRVEQVEHEAFLMLVAAQAGVNVPRVVAAGSAGSRAAVLVQRPVEGRQLAELDAETLDDELLLQIWKSVAVLHGARIVHNNLDPAHVIVVEGAPWIVGFDDAASSGSSERMAQDVAELLVGTAAIVGADRAVTAATTVLGRPGLAAALPFLQPAALSDTTRALAGARHRALGELLDRVRAAGAAAVGIEAPELTQLHRISLASAAMVIGALVAIAVLLANIGDPTAVWSTLRNADWSWISLAVALSLVSNFAYAIGLQGTVPVRLPLWPTTEVQLGMSFSNLAVPGIGGQAMQVRFLQKVGVDLSSAVAAGGILSAAGALVASLGLFTIALILEPARVNLSLIPTSGLLSLTLGLVVFVALVSAVLALVPRLRNTVMPPVARAASTMWKALRSPQHVALLIGGNVAAILLSTGCLQACLIAFGGHASFWALLAANIAIVTIAAAVPIPGGGTAVGTVGLTAALVSFGVSRDVAVAAALANQLAFYYLPAIPGWFATRHLARHDYL